MTSSSDEKMVPSGDDLVTLLREDPLLRKELKRIWRSLFPDLIATAQALSIETSTDDCDWMIRKFGLEKTLLELITDDHVGVQITEWIIECLPGGYREQFEDAFENLIDDSREIWSPSIATGTRVVIFGGHVRDERKMARLVFDNSPFEVRWKRCDPSRGAPDDRELLTAMSHADAVLIVTSMVSHGIMRLAKRLANEVGIPWRTIAKATEGSLRRALNDLFAGTLTDS